MNLFEPRRSFHPRRSCPMCATQALAPVQDSPCKVAQAGANSAVTPAATGSWALGAELVRRLGNEALVRREVDQCALTVSIDHGCSFTHASTGQLAQQIAGTIERITLAAGRCHAEASLGEQEVVVVGAAVQQAHGARPPLPGAAAALLLVLLTVPLDDDVPTAAAPAGEGRSCAAGCSAPEPRPRQLGTQSGSVGHGTSRAGHPGEQRAQF